MSYTPTQWATGDTITAEKLNNMESGIENANEPFIVTLTPTAADFSGTMDRTPQEITEAYNAGRSIVFKILASPTFAHYVQATFSKKAASDEAAQFAGYGILTERFVVFETDVSMQTYSTAIYHLTPAT